MVCCGDGCAAHLDGASFLFISSAAFKRVLGLCEATSQHPPCCCRPPQVFIDKFSQVFPDYRERVVAHEAAHLLIGEGAVLFE